MCSSEWGWQPLPAPAIAHCFAPAAVEPARPVWLLLGELFRFDPSRVQTVVVDGFDLTGRTPGFLVGQWLRGSRGLYVGRVNFNLSYADPARRPGLFSEQLVPGYALRPRHDGRSLC